MFSRSFCCLFFAPVYCSFDWFATALLIWLEDRGPVFYSQERSGWLGRPFTVLKLRTMHVHATNPSALWTLPGDQRITLKRLRRFVSMSSPLLNVLNGEMSLIGPRPERPELEHLLQRHLSHYRKRHWMRPGLSGWLRSVRHMPAVLIF